MKLISPEALSDQQQEVLKDYTPFLPAGSVCVNVMIGPEPWDLRPLLLLMGKVSIARFSDTLSEASARSIASELEGFSVLCNNQQRVQLIPNAGRFMLIRPFFSETLKDEIEFGRLTSERQRLDIVFGLIRQLAELSRRNIAHGHIAPSNIIREGAKVLIVDPVVGALHQTRDLYLAPETVSGRSPDTASDLFGLGRTILALLGNSLSGRQRNVVEQLLLPAPRQRPSLEEVAVAFGVGELATSSNRASRDAITSRPLTTSGRVLKPHGSLDNSLKNEYDNQTQSNEDLSRGAAKISSSFVPGIASGVLALIATIWIVKDRYPAMYFELSSRLPMLAAQHSAQYEEDWASRDRSRMAVVGRAGVIRREPAAINTIVNDLIAGENPQGVHGSLIRVALSDEWRNDLTPADKHAAIVFALEGLVPEGRAQLAESAKLHPGVVLAILGQIPSRSLPPDLKQLPIETLIRLPSPIGELFSQAKAMGVNQIGDPQVLGLAEIVTGNASSGAVAKFIGDNTQAAQTLAKIALIMPVITGNESAATELLALLGEREGDLTPLVHWFDLADVASWGGSKASSRISLILGNLPEGDLNLAQLADLLTFPVEKVRNQAVLKLKEVFPGADGERFLVTIATPALGLTRDQTISLVSALALKPQARAPFIPAWFNLEPAPDAVVLILLARSGVDSQDIFNLEAARYLRRNPWNATDEILKLLAGHPEPLARILAYGRLDPSSDQGRSVLLERQRIEKDESCLKALKERLASVTKQVDNGVDKKTPEGV